MADDTVPVLIDILGARTLGGGQKIQIEFGASDQHRYVLQFTAETSAKLAAVLGSLLASLKGQLHLTVVVEESSALASADGATGLRLLTRELGAIAFAVTPEGLQHLKRDLADLERVQQPASGRH
ncbi:MAG TPA: hypothetical protein VJR58_34295 [Vineibacter sp.]|nr:hypothetical protein [Vineibacter sp.]